MTSLGGLLGSMSMLFIGMLLAGADLKAIVKNPQVWLIALFRLIVLPPVVLLVLKLTTLANLNIIGMFSMEKHSCRLFTNGFSCGTILAGIQLMISISSPVRMMG